MDPRKSTNLDQSDELVYQVVSNDENDCIISVGTENFMPILYPIQGEDSEQNDRPILAEEELEYKRPKRSCLYCEKEFTNIVQHLKNCHAEEKDVYECMLIKDSLERRKAFGLLRKKGMLKRSNESGVVQMEKKGKCLDKNEFISCENCFAVIKRINKSRHRKTCISNEYKSISVADSGSAIPNQTFDNLQISEQVKVVITSLTGYVKNVAIDNDWARYILNKFLQRKFVAANARNVIKNAQSLCRSIIRVYVKVRDEIRVKYDVEIILPYIFMRKIHQHGVKINIYGIIIDSIKSIVPKQDGSRKKLTDDLKVAMKIVLRRLHEESEDEFVEELKKFKVAFESTCDELNGNVNIKRAMQSRKSRMPSQLPKAEELEAIFHFCSSEIQHCMKLKNLSQSNFIRLRQSILTTLTFHNGRRGGEVARVTIEEFKDAIQDIWFENMEDRLGLLRPTQREIAKRYKITYQLGKGSSMVPILFPIDIIVPMQRLISPANRLEVGISADNMFVFPSTHSYQNQNCDGSMDIRNLISRIPSVKTHTTATKVRHFLATHIEAHLESESDKDIIYRHFGHHANINKNVYQCPQSVTDLVTIGGSLASLFAASISSTQVEENIEENVQTSVDDPDEESENLQDSNTSNVRRNLFRDLEMPSSSNASVLEEGGLDDSLEMNFPESPDHQEPEESTSSESEDEIFGKINERHRWTPTSKSSIIQAFKAFITGKSNKRLEDVDIARIVKENGFLSRYKSMSLRIKKARILIHNTRKQYMKKSPS